VTGRSPARLLAPLALVVTAVALFAVVTSGGSDRSTSPGSSGATPAATASPKSTEEKRSRKPAARTYTVKPGDTPSSIAEQTGVDLQALLDANPDADPSALSPGQKLKLP
jgi:LysM repeat protein